MTLSIKLDNENPKSKSSRKSSKQSAIRPQTSIRESRLKNRLDASKKRSTTTKRRKVFSILGVICVLGLVAGGVTYYKAQKAANEVGVNIKPTDLLHSVVSKKDPELLMDNNGRTNALIVGIDTRDHNQGLQNTDTIIVASYNHDTNETTMISIPRDNYVEIPDENWFVKINGIYNLAEQREKNSGMEALRTVAEEFTGLEIQYYGMIDISGFKEVIDIIGGIEVNVENSFTDYAYPNDSDTGYEVVSFDAGPQTMDGDTAIKYSRSRKAQGIEGSDFMRARRQQKVIEAVKNKLLSAETLLNPTKFLELSDSLKSNIRLSEITLNDIEAGISLLRKNGTETETFSFVMDPSLGNSQLLTTGVVPNAYSVGPKLGLGNYDDLHLMIQQILKYPALYELDPNISVYDTGAGYNETLVIVEELEQQYPFLSIIYRGTLFYDKEGTVIYNNQEDAVFDSTIKRFKDSINTDSTEKPDYVTTRLNGEDITILVGKEIVVDNN
jgi:LCP family protein required for cell wall assembly